jgi:hypothetical protein
MTITRHRVATSALAAILALGVPVIAGCGGAIQNAAEEAAGNSAVGGDVNIEDDGISVTDSNGNEIQLGDDVSLPDNWPSAVPAFEGGQLKSVMVAGDGASVNAVWQADGTADEAAKAYGAALEAAGFTPGDMTSTAGMTGGDYTGNGYKVNVVVIAADGTTSVMVNAEKG